MPFSTAEFENIVNAAIDYHDKKGEVNLQSIQNKPLLRDLRAKEKAFPGGKENITIRVKGDYFSSVQGFSGDDQVNYTNPTGLRTAVFPWMLLHNGIQFTKHELMKAGITISDNMTGESASTKSDAEKTQLVDVLEDKLEDLQETTDRDMNLMYWRDGSQDANHIPGISSFIVDNPTAAIAVAGIDQVANSWWRNRANVAFAQGSDPNAQLFAQFLQREVRQLRRYSKNPMHKGYAGSDLLDWLERELRAKGQYTQDGWMKNGKMDLGVADVAFKGIELEYDPTLDDLGRSKRLYLLDMSVIEPRHVHGEKWQKHAPARPENKYVFYRGRTYAGGLTTKQRNSHGVYSIT